MATPYRLILDRAGWDGLRERLADPFHARIAANNRVALGHLRRIPPGSGPVPKRLDDPTSPEAPPGRVEKVRLVRSAVAWWLERRADDAADLCATIDHMLAGSWEVAPSNHSNGLRCFNLNTGELAWCAAFACDVLPEVLGPQRIAALRKRLVETLLPAYLSGIAENEWWSACDFNWGSATHGNAGFAALAVEEDHPALARSVLDATRRGLQPVIAALPVNGGWTEGLMYQTTMLAHLTDFVAALVRVHGDDLGLSSNSRFASCLYHRQEQLGGDDRPLNFSNINEYVGEWWMAQAYWWARRFNQQELTAFEDAHVKPWSDTNGIFHDVEAFWYRDAFQPARPRPAATSHHFSGLDWFAWRGQRWWLGVRGGHLGGNHNNHDLGQIIVGLGSRRWLVDPGYGATTAAKHNLPTVRGQDQTDCAHGPILRQAIGDDVHLAIDLHEAHPHALDRWIRHVLVLDQRVVVLIDDCLSRGGKRLSLRFHLQVRGEVSVDGERCRLRQGDDQVELHVPGPHLGLSSEAWSWGDQPLTTLSWRPAPDTPSVIQAVCLGEPGLLCSITHQANTSIIATLGHTWVLDRAILHLERLASKT